MAITLQVYWDTLLDDMQRFDKENTVKAKDSKDQETYKKEREFLNAMVTLGLKIEATSLTLMKTRNGMQLKNLPKKTFGDDQVITSFDGPLSLAFAKEVYLPHLKRFSEVEVTDQNYALQVFANLPQQKKDALLLVAKLEEAIGNYSKKTTSALVENSMFPEEKKPVEIAPPKKEHILMTASKK